jgi:hypothetical protein
MKKILLFPTLLFAYFISLSASQFDQWFKDVTMRIDYFHMGDNTEETITLDKIYQEGIWAGNHTHLIDADKNGNFAIKVYDSESSQLIYSKRFNSYFGEYQTTAKAGLGIKRTYSESAIIPWPKKEIRFSITRKNKSLSQERVIFSANINPNDINIINEKPHKKIKIFPIVKSGPPAKCVDLIVIGEGYTAEEENKFMRDLTHFADVFFKQAPYDQFKDKFNFTGLFLPSQESGCDEPTHRSFKNTALNSTFNALGSPRYLLTEDNKSLRDIAAAVPYDALLIMINHKRYGGGGIYNFYLTFTADNDWRDYVFIHEFGHSFAGLADEYYTSSTAYEDFYPNDVEPDEPNITRLMDPKNIKWKAQCDKTPLPTPWNKREYDRLNEEYQKIRQALNLKIARLKKTKASQKKIKAVETEALQKGKYYANKLDMLIRNEPYFGKTGAFEGGGYVSEGIYRPMLDCIMFSKGAKSFCSVCENAIIQKIKTYID